MFNLFHVIFFTPTALLSVFSHSTFKVAITWKHVQLLCIILLLDIFIPSRVHEFRTHHNILEELGGSSIGTDGSNHGTLFLFCEQICEYENLEEPRSEWYLF